MAHRNAPRAEVEVTDAMLGRLLHEQHPDLAGLPRERIGNGWDNVLFRLGTELAVRLPRRALAAPLVGHEMRWLPELAPRLALPVPVPVRTGSPTEEYPYQWVVVPFFAGRPLAGNELADPDASAELLGRFLASLHTVAPPDAPQNPFRGQPLEQREPVTLRRLAALGDELRGEGVEPGRVQQVWSDVLEVDQWDGPPIWLHGDLHPLNIIERHGSIAAVVDFGDITAGDPATDLMVAWSLFDEPRRELLRNAAGSSRRPLDPATWARGRGWAITHSLAVIERSADNRVLRTVALRTLRAATSG